MTLGMGNVAKYLVPASQSCNPPTGACCLLSGTCQQLTAVNCQVQSGTFGGNAVSCTGFPCGPQGGCCDGGGNCTIHTQSDCVNVFGGTYAGNGVPCG